MRLFILSLIFVSVCCLAANLVAQDVNTDANADTSAATNTTKTDDLLDPYREAAKKRWGQAIDQFDAENQSQRDPADAILFIGSSSVRRWDTMATDMTPYRTVRRGYGGAKFTDVAVFADRIVTPHSYRALVMFVGNGVTGKPEDHTPDQIEALARHIVGVSHKHQAGSPVFLIEITPCEKRFDAWPKIRAVNARLREIALSSPNTYFVATASHFLNADAMPRPELFVSDKLHLNDAGYDLWSTLIRRRLDDVFRSNAMAAQIDQEKAAVDAEAAVKKKTAAVSD